MSIVIIAHNIRSTYNVGSIIRTADGFGVSKIYCTGYTPYPALPGDERLPHISNKITNQIHKTALGAEKTMCIEHSADPAKTIDNLKKSGYKIVALEQSPRSILLQNYKPPKNIALLLGEEVHGITPGLLAMCDETIEIPMFGQKESFNVSVATGIALYGISTALA